MDATERRWRQDFANTTDAIPDTWLVRDGQWVGIDTTHRDEPIVTLYRSLMCVGYARGWL